MPNTAIVEVTPESLRPADGTEPFGLLAGPHAWLGVDAWGSRGPRIAFGLGPRDELPLPDSMRSFPGGGVRRQRLDAAMLSLYRAAPDTRGSVSQLYGYCRRFNASPHAMVVELRGARINPAADPADTLISLLADHIVPLEATRTPGSGLLALPNQQVTLAELPVPGGGTALHLLSADVDAAVPAPGGAGVAAAMRWLASGNDAASPVQSFVAIARMPLPDDPADAARAAAHPDSRQAAWVTAGGAGAERMIALADAGWQCEVIPVRHAVLPASRRINGSSRTPQPSDFRLWSMGGGTNAGKTVRLAGGEAGWTGTGMRAASVLFGTGGDLGFTLLGAETDPLSRHLAPLADIVTPGAAHAHRRAADDVSAANADLYVEAETMLVSAGERESRMSMTSVHIDGRAIGMCNRDEDRAAADLVELMLAELGVQDTDEGRLRLREALGPAAAALAERVGIGAAEQRALLCSDRAAWEDTLAQAAARCLDRDGIAAFAEEVIGSLRQAVTSGRDVRP